MRGSPGGDFGVVCGVPDSWGGGGSGGLLQITSPRGGPGKPLRGLESLWPMVLPDMERRGPWGAVTYPGRGRGWGGGS